jgi:hypothetical protein
MRHITDTCTVPTATAIRSVDTTASLYNPHGKPHTRGPATVGEVLGHFGIGCFLSGASVVGRLVALGSHVTLRMPY